MNSTKPGSRSHMRGERPVPDSGNPAPSLTGIERARILLASLDSGSSSAIFKALDANTRALLEASGIRVPDLNLPRDSGTWDHAGLPGHEVGILLEEFCSLMTEAEEGFPVPELLPPDDRLPEPGMTGLECPDADVARVLDLARTSDPDTLATIVGCMESTNAVTVLSSLPRGIRSEVCRRIVRMDYLNACRTGAGPGSGIRSGSDAGSGAVSTIISTSANGTGPVPGAGTGCQGPAASGIEGSKLQGPGVTGSETQADSLYSLFPVNPGSPEE